MDNKSQNPFTIIKQHGEPNRASFEGMTITRQQKLYIDGFGMVPCVPYDDHFVFEVPAARLRVGMWKHMCTCGSHAVVASPEDVTGRMLVCFFYHQKLYEDGHGYHQTSVINKDSFDQIAGQTIKLPKGRRWLI